MMSSCCVDHWILSIEGDCHSIRVLQITVVKSLAIPQNSTYCAGIVPDAFRYHFTKNYASIIGLRLATCTKYVKYKVINYVVFFAALFQLRAVQFI